VAFRRSLVPELGVALARGEWICLDTGASGQNLLELYAYQHFRPYRDAVMAIGAMAGLIGSDGVIRRLRSVRYWSQELHPLHADNAAFLLDPRYPPRSMMLPYRNAVGHTVAQIVRVQPWLGPLLDLYRCLWRHSQSTETQWIETFPRSPYPVFNADQIFRRRDADIIFAADEFDAYQLAGRFFVDRIFSAVPGGLENLPRADLTSLCARRVGVVLRREDIPYGRRIEAALLRAGVAETFFLLKALDKPTSFAELDAAAAAEGLDLLPVLDGDQPAPGAVVVWEAGQPIPGGAVELPMIINPILRAGERIWIYGDPKTGKTWLVHALALLAARGAGAVGPWTAVEPTHVLYVDGEMHPADLRRNIKMVMKGADNATPGSDKLPFAVLSAREQPDGVIDLEDPVWQDQIEALLPRWAVLILDNFQSLTGNGPGALKAIQPWLIRLSRAGIAVIIMDHTNRDGILQGSAVKERIADLCIFLHYDGDADQAAGIMTFELLIARRLYGTDTQKFRLQRIFTPDSFIFRWLDPVRPSGPELSPSEEERVRQIAGVIVALENGLTYDGIQNQLAIARSTAHGLKKAASTLRGAARVRFDAECDRLRRTPDA